ncbi:MAG: ABC transporter ATP-binding protein [Acidiferrobacterales bacterium]|nr:ABC transporter ATP-binding protein [Acidiferrobacterales bacterium]
MAISIQNLVKEFGDPPTRIIHGLNFVIGDSEFVSISGRSGSGKSTLLYIISTLDQPTEGSIIIDGVNPADMSVEELHHFRNTNIGFVFQFHYLLPELTALENVLMPARNIGQHIAKRDEALAMLREFGIENKQDHLPSQMSGGEQQRVAIARALIMQPKYIFADEPTGNLDSVNGKIVMDLLKRVNQELGATLVVVTHEPDYARMAGREIYLADGRIEQVMDNGVIQT